MSEAVEAAANTAAADQSSFEAALAAALAVSEPAKVEAAEAAVEQSAAVAPPPAAPAPVETAPPPPVSARELERIAALDAREAKLREAESSARAREDSLKAAEARTAAQWETFESNPVAHIKALRPDLTPAQAAKVAERIYFYALGDQAPPQHRQQQEVADVRDEVKKTVAELRAELETERARAAQVHQEAQLSQYRAELRSGAAAVTDAPTVARLVQLDPSRAESMLFEVARMAAVESKQAGSAEPVVLTPAQAAAKLESILQAQRAEYEKLYGTPSVKTQPNVQQIAPSPTISNRDASIQPSRSAPDPLDDKSLRKAALEAAGLGHLEVWD